MKSMISFFCLLVVSLSAMSFQADASVTVIVNPANENSFDEKTIQRIFLGKEKAFADGSQAQAINLALANDSREVFDTEVLGRSSSQVNAYWSKLVFTGKGVPPKEFASEAEVVAFVASNPNAIGYVSASAVDGSVKAISF